jgi:hypothetical protein
MDLRAAALADRRPALEVPEYGALMSTNGSGRELMRVKFLDV